MVLIAGMSVWVIVRGILWKVPSDMVRRATGEEKSGIDAVEAFLPDLKEQIEQRGRRR